MSMENNLPNTSLETNMMFGIHALEEPIFTLPKPFKTGINAIKNCLEGLPSDGFISLKAAPENYKTLGSLALQIDVAVHNFIEDLPNQHLFVTNKGNSSVIKNYAKESLQRLNREYKTDCFYVLNISSKDDLKEKIQEQLESNPNLKTIVIDDINEYMRMNLPLNHGYTQEEREMEMVKMRQNRINTYKLFGYLQHITRAKSITIIFTHRGNDIPTKAEFLTDATLMLDKVEIFDEEFVAVKILRSRIKEPNQIDFIPLDHGYFFKKEKVVLS